MWLQFLEIMLLADLVQYWVHRMFHQIPWLWKFHAVHHSAEVMDWMAGNRLHLVDLALTRSLIYIPSFILGFDDLADGRLHRICFTSLGLHSCQFEISVWLAEVCVCNTAISSLASRCRTRSDR